MHASTSDVIVLGVGAMGSAAAHQLARRGVRVVGLEQYTIGHDRGSSHGDTRLIRQAYFEDPSYVPLLLRAYTLWSELEAAARATLFHRIGLVLFGAASGNEVVEGVLESARRFAIPLQRVEPAEARSAWPGLRPPEGCVGLFEPGAGYLEVERCVRAQAEQARQHGAVIHEGVVVRSWRADGSGVVVDTDRGTFAAERLVVTAGAWSGPLLADLGLPLQVHRTLLYWFPEDGTLAPGPCFAFALPEGFFYGFPPRSPDGVKAALHLPGHLVADPAQVDRASHPEDLAPLAAFVQRCLPSAKPSPSRHAVCMYTMTPDQHFVVDRHPRHSNVVFAAGFSGHGFKFAPVIGEALADLAQRGRTELPIAFLALRF